jgi:hypothetical protein
MAGNLFQLEGLCERMDETAFLPLRSEELTSGYRRRLLQYTDLVDQIMDTLVADGLISVKNLRATGTKIAYLRYFVTINTTPVRTCSLEYNIFLWNKCRDTPVWLSLRGENWKFSPDIREKLVSLELQEPSSLIREGDAFYVPIFLETGVERDAVIKGMLEQIKKVLVLLQ